MKKDLLCGIDVGSKELVVAIDPGTRHVWEGIFPNDAAGHRKLIRRLTRAKVTARVCVEATGIYHLDLCLALEGAKGIEVMVAVMRKLLHAIHGMFQRDADFDGTKFFAETA